MCIEKNVKHESFGVEQLFSLEMIAIFGISTSYELQKKQTFYIGQLCWVKK